MVGSVTFYAEVPPGEKTPQRLTSRYVSHMPEEHAPTFKAKFETELAYTECKLPPDVTKALLLDGARPLWNHDEHNARFEDYTNLIDYCHTVEHLSLENGQRILDKEPTTNQTDGMISGMNTVRYSSHEAGNTGAAPLFLFGVDGKYFCIPRRRGVSYGLAMASRYSST